MLASELRSSARRLLRAASALWGSRAVTKSVAPVFASARAVSIPRPEEQPVITMTLSVSFPLSCSSWMI
jgi:hypothetical protein